MVDIFNIIIKELNNCASTTELIELEEWVKEDYNNSILKTQFVKAWKGDYVDIEKVESRSWKKIEREIKKTTYSDSFYVQNWFKLAAAITFILLSLFTYYIFDSKIQDQTVAEETIEYIEYKTQNGQVKQLLLPDSSVVILKNNSVLKVPSTNNIVSSRKVELLGEAFFKVHTNKSDPFIVISKSFSTTVTGTAFSINDYPEDKFKEVIVLEGVVQVQHVNTAEHEAVMVGKNEMLIYADNKLVKKETNSTIKDWGNENIVFEGDNFERVIMKLQRHFNIKISIEKKDLDREKSFVGVFYKDETISDILDLLVTQFNFRYEINDNEIIIK